MEEELETLRLGLVELRKKYDEALQRELELTQRCATLMREKREVIEKHRHLREQLGQLAQGAMPC